MLSQFLQADWSVFDRSLLLHPPVFRLQFMKSPILLEKREHQLSPLLFDLGVGAKRLYFLPFEIVFISIIVAQTMPFPQNCQGL